MAHIIVVQGGLQGSTLSSLLHKQPVNMECCTSLKVFSGLGADIAGIKRSLKPKPDL